MLRGLLARILIRDMQRQEAAAGHANFQLKRGNSSHRDRKQRCARVRSAFLVSHARRTEGITAVTLQAGSTEILGYPATEGKATASPFLANREAAESKERSDATNRRGRAAQRARTRRGKARRARSDSGDGHKASAAHRARALARNRLRPRGADA